eukprot:CAMPEP_0172039684 /NCGR_PEP_ID=MMETSP1041-20130122/24045_1 /TAXON_ID=464988 /ORGANISM="Hemiselmis andersenii, Strain CCMP439" /LENGTH=214 /DNA_ID=CAMNT_0012697429 /DNA_START=42 /DNA_END=683 /DNA_ORIENTATION=-
MNQGYSSGVRTALMLLSWAVFTAVLSRATFLLVAPYHMRGFVPNLVQELLFGILYPLVNLSAVKCLFLNSPDPLRTRPWLYCTAHYIVGCQFVIQITFDALRAYGHQPMWHWICQVFYSVWGCIVLVFNVYYALKASKPWWIVMRPIISFVLVCHSVVLLSVSIGSRDSDSYFGVMTWIRVLELDVVLNYFLTLQASVAAARRGAFDEVQTVKA